MKTNIPVTWNETNHHQRLSFSDLAPRSLSARCWKKLEDFKRALTRQLAREHAGALPVSLLQRAIDDAWSLATLTPFPHLFLPALAEEKVATARKWFVRQRRISARPLFAVAA